MLDFSPLQKALATLAEALAAAKERPGDLFVRDAAIQRFEYSYELCIKSLRRQLEAMADSPSQIDGLGYKDMLRLALERKLLANTAPWFVFRELRNITSHTYDASKAERVFAGLPQFLRAAKSLDTALRKVNR